MKQGLETDLSGKRVVVSADGGRIRVRSNKKGRRTKKKRKRYNTAWREPKLIIVYVVNDDGRLDQSFAPIIDGKIGGPKDVVEMLRGYLKNSRINESKRILFVGDGAKWLWNRIGSLISSLGAGQILVQLLDFYHAVEHLATIANNHKDWTTKKRKTWINTVRKLLLDGKVDDAIEKIKEATAGRSKVLHRERKYFLSHRNHLDYAVAEMESLPRGSGAVESAIRRVVNLRLKGAGIFWHLDTANELIFLRSFHKAGRWENIEGWATSVESLLDMGYEISA